MAQPDPRSPKNTRPPNGNGAGDPNFNWRGLVLFAIAVAMLGGAYVFHNGGGPMIYTYASYWDYAASPSLKGYTYIPGASYKGLIGAYLQ